MAFPAKFNGTCVAPECLISPASKLVVVGQAIVWSRHARGRVYHAECYDAYRKAKTDSRSIDPPEEITEVEPSDTLQREVSTRPTPNVAERIFPDTFTLAQGKPTLAPTPAVSTGNPLADTLAQAIAPFLEGRLNGKVDESTVSIIVDDKLMEFKRTMETTVLELISTLDRPIRIEVHNPETNETRNVGVAHKQFATLLSIASARTHDGHRLNIELVGPSGSGKTHAAKQIADALGVKFYYSGAVMEPWSLLGFKNAHGEYQRTAFREAYEHGGVFLLDEKDASDANAILPFNAATANGHCPFPDGMVERHKDCLIMAASNTWGLGGTNDYVGRLRQDAASLDRFIQLPWEVDEKLELSTCGNAEWCKYVQRIRRNVASKGIKVIISPRASYYGSALLAQGIDRAMVETIVVRKAMTGEQWASVQ